MSVLITGASGQVGGALLRCGPGSVVGVGHSDLDLEDPQRVGQVIRRIDPRMVIHAAAWTDVDGCELDPARAWTVNAEGTAAVVRAALDRGARVLYVSTDYVFSGKAVRPYGVDDEVGPVSAYGISKLGGELSGRALGGDRFSTVRTSWVFSQTGRNFVKTVLRLASTEPELRVVADQRGSPTYAPDLAQWIWEAIESGASGDTFHACNAGECTWFEMATQVLRLSGQTTPVRPVSTAQFPRPARRPSYSVLSPSWGDKSVGRPMRHWQAALAECLGVGAIVAE